MRLEFHPSTIADVNEAVTYYQRMRPGLESEFRRELHAAIKRIAKNPLLFPIVEAQIQRCIVHRFPYSILFRTLDSDRIWVLAIRHHKRNPRFGVARK